MLGAVTSIATSVVPNIGISFATPSEKRAAKVLPSVVQSALAGNGTAWRCLDERRTRGITKERAVWTGGYNQAATQRPDLLTLYNANKDKVPAIDHTSPESAAASALANPYALSPGNQPSSNPGTPALARAGAAFAAMPLWLVLGLAGVAGYFAFKKLR